MTQPDGLDLAQQIRQTPGVEDVRLIFLTSIDEQIDLATMTQLGVIAKLTKPVRQSDLFEALLRVVRGGSFMARGGKRPTESKEAVVSDNKGRHTARVLIVEDNEVNQMVTANILEKSWVPV